MIEKLLPQLDLAYSLRRSFVDNFFHKQVFKIKKNASIFDLGGRKNRKRGTFTIEEFGFTPCYGNISHRDLPDIVLDGVALPIKDNTFDVVICAEVLEHIYEPKLVLKEISRILKPQGKALISVPFLYPIHSDPSDFGRFTDTFWKKVLNESGFSSFSIQAQGSFFSVITDFFRIFFIELQNHFLGKIPGFRSLTWLFFSWGNVFLFQFVRKLEKSRIGKGLIRSSFTTGFEIVAIKGI